LSERAWETKEECATTLLSLPSFLRIVVPFSQCFSLVSYGSVGGASSVIDRQINFDRKLLRRIEQITEMASSSSIQKKSRHLFVVAKSKVEIQICP